MYKLKSISFFFVVIIFSSLNLVSCGSSDSQSSPQTSEITLHPVTDFYINCYWNTDSDTFWYYETDISGDDLEGVTGSETGNSGGTNYNKFRKLIFNFNISNLSGTTIQHAYLRIFVCEIRVIHEQQNAILENIFYGNIDSLPVEPRNYDDEFGGYIESPVISGTAAATELGWIQIDVTDKLQADIDAGRTNSQFRLSHENANNRTSAYLINWFMVDSATEKPELIVTYY